jgi:serine/threonine-protein kinase
VSQALRLGLQIAEALRAAHERGIVHRDLKPSNIKIRPDGVLKVLDFGLAKAIEPPSRADGSASPTATSPAPLTSAGTVLGTTAYMSPEQARGLPVDQRTDIWALGCVLFEMVSGRRAFDGATGSDQLVAVLDRDPDWTALPAAVPEGVRRVIRRCLAKDTRRRLSAAADVRIELEEADGTAASSDRAATPDARHAPSRGRGWTRVAVAAGASALAGIAIGWWLRPLGTTPDAPVTHTLITVAPADHLGGAGVLELSPFGRSRPRNTAIALSPDGRTVAFTARRQGRSSLYLKSLSAADATPVSGSDDADGPVFSPDGAWIAYWAQGAIWKTAITGGPPVKLCDQATAPGGMSWGHDDRIAFASTTIRVVPSTGGRPQEITKLAEGERHFLPQLMPGNPSTWMLFTILPAANEWDRAQVVAQSLATGERRVLLEGAADARYVATGHLMFMRMGRLMAAPFDLTRMALTGGEVGVLDDVMQEVGTTAVQLDTGSGQYAVSASGTLAYVRGDVLPDAENVLQWVRRDGSTEPIAAPRRPYFSVRLSPDGRHVALGTLGLRDQSIWRYDLADGNLIRLTTEGRAEQPIWTPDGSRLVFSFAVGGPYNLFGMPADGSGPPARLLTGQGFQFPGAWTPDGRLIFVENIRLFVKETDGAVKPLLNTRFLERMPDLSPDGRWLAYVSNETGRSEVFVRSYPDLGGKRQVSLEGGTEPAWSRDGKKLVYIVQLPAPKADRAQFMEADVSGGAALTIGRPRLLFEIPFDGATAARSWDMTPDAQRFLTVLDSWGGVSAPREIHLVQGWFNELRAKTASTTR